MNIWRVSTLISCIFWQDVGKKKRCETTVVLLTPGPFMPWMEISFVAVFCFWCLWSPYTFQTIKLPTPNPPKYIYIYSIYNICIYIYTYYYIYIIYLIISPSIAIHKPSPPPPKKKKHMPDPKKHRATAWRSNDPCVLPWRSPSRIKNHWNLQQVRVFSVRLPPRENRGGNLTSYWV